MFNEHDLSNKILDNFRAVTYSFLVCENNFEFQQTRHILGAAHHNRYFTGQLSGNSCMQSFTVYVALLNFSARYSQLFASETIQKLASTFFYCKVDLTVISRARRVPLYNFEV